MFSNDDVYEDNTFENNGAGVAVMFSKRISMYNNIFKENWGTASYGLLLKEIMMLKLKAISLKIILLVSTLKVLIVSIINTTHLKITVGQSK